MYSLWGLDINMKFYVCSENDHGPHLSYEEMTTVRRNLATAGVEADNELVRFAILV